MAQDRPSVNPDAEQALIQIASQIHAQAQKDRLHRRLIGIHRGGAWVAQRLHAKLLKSVGIPWCLA